MYCKHHRMFLKEIEEGIKRRKNVPCSWKGRINVVKMSMLPRAIYTFHAIPIKVPWTFFRVGTNHLQSSVAPGRPKRDRGLFKTNTTAGDITMPDFRLDYKAVAIKTVW